MRKITSAARAAFLSGARFSLDNTRVKVDRERCTLSLHGHEIAASVGFGNEEVTFSLCGWNTPTTRERLHAAGLSVGTKKGTPYLHAVETPAGGFLRLDKPAPLDPARTYRVNLYTGALSVAA